MPRNASVPWWKPPAARSDRDPRWPSEWRSACAAINGPSRVYVILGDGELQEGQVWEAALSAASFGLDNLCLIIDRNYMQVDGHTDKVMKLEPLAGKWSAFGWHVLEIDGNDMTQITDALDAARAAAGPAHLHHCIHGAGQGSAVLREPPQPYGRISPDEADRALSLLREERA